MRKSSLALAGALALGFGLAFAGDAQAYWVTVGPAAGHGQPYCYDSHGGNCGRGGYVRRPDGVRPPYPQFINRGPVRRRPIVGRPVIIAPRPHGGVIGGTVYQGGVPGARTPAASEPPLPPPPPKVIANDPGGPGWTQTAPGTQGSCWFETPKVERCWNH